MSWDFIHLDEPRQALNSPNMESFLPLSSFQLPFQKGLSRLYNDTKKSSDFVKEPVKNEEDPEIRALHRKLRVQKDRLVSWGLEWSDPNQATEIDESLSKAGLSEVVGSIMSTIKDILAEAEPLWLSSKRIIEGPRTAPDRKPALVQWDKGRFEDLVGDLTSSIDTLYDVSRTRSAASRRPKLPSKTSTPSGDDFRPFERSRRQDPKQIDQKTLRPLRPRPGSTALPSRSVIIMSKTDYADLGSGQPWAPLLLEYATFDTMYSATGIMPEMSRFEKLSAALQQDTQRAPTTWTGLPRLVGHFEDIENSRLGLVYRLPPSFTVIETEKVSHDPSYYLFALDDLLSRPENEPALEAKFRLASNLANTVFDMHARGLTHGNLVEGNVSFCRSADGGFDIRKPLVSSFDLFSEDSTGSKPSRHPLDPCNRNSPLSRATDERVLELYSLAMMLLSIGLWRRLDVLAADSPSVSTLSLEELTVKCGSLYMKAVQACWFAVDDEARGALTGANLIKEVQTKVSRYLEACCILDGVSTFEDSITQELRHDLPLPPVAEAPRSRDVKSPVLAAPGLRPAVVPETIRSREETTEPVNEGTHAGLQVRPSLTPTVETPKPESRSDTKIRLYPHVPLTPDVVQKWNSILMPQINHALRHFYRKHAESVEISLESIGPSPQKTQPTVLVVCTSVGKIRAILNKRVSALFDESTGFALRVSRGQLVRSHRQPNSVMRSMADYHDKLVVGGEEVDAVNPQYQTRPSNGASIGAWIGDRHLPPVSFGGLVIIDDKPYGMTVHHMLDDPDRDMGSGPVRSSAYPESGWYTGEELPEDLPEDDYDYELSDTESEAYSETDITSDYGDDESEAGDFEEPGDIPGVEPGCGEGYFVTQPALDDVEDGFYPCAETEDDDHLDTYSLGEVYASSGIRRKEAHGLIHEVDWALFEFSPERLPTDNTLPRAQTTKNTLLPTAVVPSSSLPGMEVQCLARTSGLQTGQILPALTSVKIYGRTSASHAYQVTSATSQSGIPMGIPGDSGAWIVSRDDGQVCGHVLAWSQRKHVAYICPMDVLLSDIAQTLDASEIRLPGGEVIVRSSVRSGKQSVYGTSVSDLDTTNSVESESESEEEMESPLVEKLASSNTSRQALSRQSGHSTPSPVLRERSGELNRINSGLSGLAIGRGIGVGG